MFDDLITWAVDNGDDLRELRRTLDDIDREGGERVKELDDLVPDEIRDLCQHRWALELALRLCRYL